MGDSLTASGDPIYLIKCNFTTERIAIHYLVLAMHKIDETEK